MDVVHHVDLSVATTAPLSVGARGVLEGPGRLRLSIEGGWLPGPYLDLTNGVATSFGWYDQLTADLIGATLEDSLIVRTHVGWRPFDEHGFQFEAGYGLVALGGGLSGAEVVAAATGQELPGDLGEGISFSTAATLHMVDVSAGWEWPTKWGLVVRADLGGAVTLGAPTTVEADFDAPFFAEDAVAGFEQEAAGELREILETYVHVPTVAVGVGWRFE